MLKDGSYATQAVRPALFVSFRGEQCVCVCMSVCTRRWNRGENVCAGMRFGVCFERTNYVEDVSLSLELTDRRKIESSYLSLRDVFWEN